MLGRTGLLLGLVAAPHASALRTAVIRSTAVRLCASVGAGCNVVDTRSLPSREQAATAERMATVVNWAYRGKNPEGDESAWTGERHLLSGTRTTASDVLGMLRAADDEGAAARAIFLATRSDECLGTIQVEAGPSSSDGGKEAEVGLFSVDPDLQGQGVGKALLRTAEQHATKQMGAELAVLWVITSRAELISWYERLGYVRTEKTVPFPTDANVGVPVDGMSLEFVRLEKPLV